MNKVEPLPQDLCLLCGEFMGAFKKSTKDVTDFSQKCIVDTLGKLSLIMLYVNVKIIVRWMFKVYIFTCLMSMLRLYLYTTSF